jgi:hypothetical protein
LDTTSVIPFVSQIMVKDSYPGVGGSDKAKQRSQRCTITVHQRLAVYNKGNSPTFGGVGALLDTHGV